MNPRKPSVTAQDVARRAGVSRAVVSRALSNNGSMVSEIHSEQDLAQTLRRFAQFRVSGVIVTSGQPPEALVNECVQQHIPVVGINRQPTIPGVDYVCSDNAAGAELAADQLLRSGCQRFGWLNHHPSTWAGRMRGEAFGRALQTRGVDVERHLAGRGLYGRVSGRGARRRGAGGDLLRQRPACLWLSRWNAPARQRGSGGFSADWF